MECQDIPNNRNEIPTPDIIKHQPHLRRVMMELSPLDCEAEILLLVGRDAHHVLEQVLGPPNSPFAQRLTLGWAIIGDMCIGRNHSPDKVNSCKTYLSTDGRATVFPPCPNKLKVSETLKDSDDAKWLNTFESEDGLASNIFDRTKDDDTVGLSFEDREFIALMEKELHTDEDGHWCSPLPFRSPRKFLPNNRSMVVQRTRSLERSLKRDPVKREDFFAFMQELIDNNHAEVAPPLTQDEECWYLPVVGIYHPKKPGQIRCVFDSSATYEGVSLNSELLSGPQLTNSLLGVLVRFRKERIGIMADIQTMFYSFTVREDHRNYLRFLW